MSPHNAELMGVKAGKESKKAINGQNPINAPPSAAKIQPGSRESSVKAEGQSVLATVAERRKKPIKKSARPALLWPKRRKRPRRVELAWVICERVRGKSKRPSNWATAGTARLMAVLFFREASGDGPRAMGQGSVQ